MAEQVYWDSATLLRRLKENQDIRLIDVRSPTEFESMHIPGSYNVPMNTLDEHAPRIRQHVRDPIVFVCLSGQRATQAREKASASGPEALGEAGLTQVHVLADGLRAWEAAGGEVKRGQARWSMERQIRLITGTIILASIVFSVFVPGLKWIAAFVGAGLTFAALTNVCAMEKLLARMPWNRADRADVSVVVDKLIADTSRPKAA